MEIEVRPVEQVFPYDSNPRVRPKEAVEKVASSLRAYGWRQPIVVDVDGVIIAGHTRFEAAKLLGLRNVPVHVAKDMTPEAVRAYRIADNRVAEETDWDQDLLAKEIAELSLDGVDLSALGFSDEEMIALLKAVDVSEGEGGRDAPVEFKKEDPAGGFAYCCPRCQFEWNGKPR